MARLVNFGFGRVVSSTGLRASIACALVLTACSTSREAPEDSGSGITFDADLSRDAGTDGGEDAARVGPPAPGDIGAACTTDGQCGEGSCLESSGLTPDGYCSVTCSEEDPCPVGAVCLQVDRTTSICFDACNPDATARECRQGYGCSFGDFGDEGVCLGGCTDDTDCPTGQRCDPDSNLAQAGACFTPDAPFAGPCTSSGDCGEGAFCLDEQDAGWPGGLCLALGCDLETNEGCPTNGVCIGVGGGDNACFTSCDEDADCRTGYRCSGEPGDPRRFCDAGCTLDSHCSGGRVCNEAIGSCDVAFDADDLGDACTMGGVIACEGGTCLRTSISGYPGSYCVYEGCTPGTDSTCPTGGVCVDRGEGQVPACHKGCVETTDCRAGYVCRPSDRENPESAKACMPQCTMNSHCASMRFECNEGVGLCLFPFNDARQNQACVENAECPGGDCLTEAAEGWPGGMCVEVGCRVSGTGPGETCASNATCVDEDEGDPEIGVCLDECMVGVSGGCRAGYACEPLPGSTTEEGFCKPACTPGSCSGGRVCSTTTGLCERPT